VSRSHGHVLVLTGRSVSCPAATLGCRVHVTLTARIATAARASRRTRTIELASGSLSIAAGRRATITLHLGRSAIALLRRVRQLRCTLTISARTGEGVASAAAIALRLSAPRWLPGVADGSPHA
jgi:hypothetical protein